MNKYTKKSNVGIQSEISTICKIFTKHYDLEVISRMFTRTRKREVSELRQILETLLYRHSGHKYSLKYVGSSVFENRDHSTVINSLNKVDDFCSVDKKFRAHFNKILLDYKNTQNGIEIQEEAAPLVGTNLYDFYEYLNN